jgi:hypothetical protein
MREIWIPELFGALFILIYLIRPLFKGLWPLDGIAWFPILALGVAAAIFPAYGFRPEYLPLLVYQGLAALLCVKHLLQSRRGAVPRGRGPFLSLSAVSLLALCCAVALYFAPPDLPPVKPRLVQVRDGNRGYSLHIFDAPDPSGDLIFLVPPGFGGIRAVDSLCAALGDRGFTVISYTRPGLRSPAELARLWSSFRRGAVLKKANEAGRALEEEKRREIGFILPYIRENLGALAPAAEGGTLFLAGWGAGGSALYYLTSEQEGRFPIPGSGVYGARGLVAVESRLWSSWEPDPPPALVTADQNPLLRALGGLRRWFARFRPERIRGPAGLQSPALPVLCLVSGRALDGEKGGRDYAAIFAGLRNSQGPAALAALEGAGPLDYSDFPREYPLYSALFPGPKGAAPGGSGETAALIARFCELAGAAGPSAPENRESRQGLYLETWYWNLGDLRIY